MDRPPPHDESLALALANAQAVLALLDKQFRKRNAPPPETPEITVRVSFSQQKPRRNGRIHASAREARIPPRTTVREVRKSRTRRDLTATPRSAKFSFRCRNRRALPARPAA